MAVATETKAGWGGVHVVPSGEVLFDPMAQLSTDAEDRVFCQKHLESNSKRYLCIFLGIFPTPLSKTTIATLDIVRKYRFYRTWVLN